MSAALIVWGARTAAEASDRADRGRVVSNRVVRVGLLHGLDGPRCRYCELRRCRQTDPGFAIGFGRG